MAAHGDPRGQGAHRSVRRTVDRVGERFDERSRRPFARAGRLETACRNSGEPEVDFYPFVSKCDSEERDSEEIRTGVK
ncbi:hypothetical protein ACFWH4_24520 [Streptomyces sp. NPDC127091]|uniref:hypothetical protein n=1 Tax=Streptomyces sp. NPDC127091 TaxID=3347134 RepID=UPI00365FAA3C